MELIVSYSVRADALTQLKMYQRALEDYSKLLEWVPASCKTYRRRGLVEFRLGNCDKALADLGKAVELKPDDTSNLREIPLRLAAQCPEERFRQGVLALADKCIALTDGAAAAYVTRGRLHAAFGQPEKALADFNKAIELEPSSCDAWTSRAEFHADQGHWEQAAADFAKAVEVQSETARDCGRLARCLATHLDHRLWQPEQAVELAKRAITLGPKDGWDVESFRKMGIYWNTLGVAQYRAGQWKAAVEALHKAMEYRGDGEASDWFFLAMAHWQLGNQEEARTWHQKAVEWMSKNEPDEEEADELRRFAEEAAALLAGPET